MRWARPDTRMVIAGAIGAGVLLLVGFVAYSIASSDGGGDPLDEFVTDGGPQPIHQMPVSGFALLETEVHERFLTNTDLTYERGPGDYLGFRYFSSPEDAQAKLAAWSYEGSYITQFEPAGQQADLVRGWYIIDIELSMFGSLQGAHSFYSQVVSSTEQAEGLIEIASGGGHGNVRFATKVESGTLTGTTVDAIFYRYTFRRGNVVAVVELSGATDVMEDEWVGDVARGIDEKLLGDRAAPTPTIIGGIATPPPVFDSGTPTPIN